MAADKTKFIFNPLSGKFDAVQDVSGLAETSALSAYQLLSEKAQPNGYASLNGSGTIPATQLPAIAITDTYVVASQAAMLALSAAETGDVAVRTDLSKTFILKGTTYSTLADWQELLTPTDAVLSVNGQTGIVTLNSDDVPEGSTNLYFTTARAKSAAVQDTIVDSVTDIAPSQNAVFDALALKAPLASPALTGTPTAPTAAPATSTTQIATTAFVIANAMVNPMTTGGDLIYGATSGGGAPARLAPGNTGDILQANGTNNPPSWVTPNSSAVANTVVSRNGQAAIVARFFAPSFSTTATTGGTSALSNTSSGTQIYTGTSTHTVTMPANNSLTLGAQYWFKNRSTGVVTINSNGGNLIRSMAANSSMALTLKTISLDSSATPWDVTYNIEGTGVQDFSVDVFSGTGSQVAYTLASAPGSVNNTDVYISGLEQFKSTYTVVGTTLTFSEAPPSGTNNIEVKYGTALSIGTPGSGTVTASSIATGAVGAPALAALAVGTAALAAGAVTPAKMSTANQVSLTGTNTTVLPSAMTPITGLTTSFTASGNRPLEITLRSTQTSGGSPGSIDIAANASTASLLAYIALFDNGGEVEAQQLGIAFSSASTSWRMSYAPSSIRFIINSPVAGARTYDIRAKAFGNTFLATTSLGMYIREV